MVSSAATTVAAYLKSLPKERRAVVSAVRAVIRQYLPEGYVESMNWGMICYEIPLRRYPVTYNGQPLAVAALAAQKNYYALYLMCVYQDAGLLKKLKDHYRKAGKKLDMGKACIRFRSLDDLPLDVIGEIVATVPPDAYIARYEAVKKTGKKEGERS
jgi:hypothetical protein